METLSDRSYLDHRNQSRFRALDALLNALQTNSSLSTPVLDCVEEFADLIKSGEIETIVSETLAEMALSSSFEPPWMSTLAEEWFIAESPAFSLTAFIAKPATVGTINSLKEDCLIGNLSHSPIDLIRHTFPPLLNREVFSKDVVLIAGHRESVSHAEIAKLECAIDVPEYVVQAPTLLIRLSPKAYAPLVWVFDKKTRIALMCTASYDAPVRNQAVAELLEHIALEPAAAVEPALEILCRLTKSQHHYVRWRALQSLCAIHFDFAKPYLIGACADRHPIVAKAAQSAAQQLALI